MGKKFSFPGRDGLRFERDAWGVIHVLAADETEMFRGLGYAHGRDRALQLLLMRILGRGEGSRHLAADQAMLNIDVFFRRMNWYSGFEAELARLTPKARALCAAYCDGLNTSLRRAIPAELKLLGYNPEPWTMADCILLSRMTGYVSLSQSQAEIENLLLQMAQNGVDSERLEAFFGPLPELDLELLRQIRPSEPIVPAEVRWNTALPKLVASNNWVISGSKTRSGRAMLANDPHLEGNRLPNVWYEVVLETPERYALANTMPGLPGVLLGRTPDLAWGATYTFMDAVDSWVEDCRDGRYRRHREGRDEWLPFRQREEIIERKGQPSHKIVFYENEHGTLSEPPAQDGYYLATRWASGQSGGESLNHIAEMWAAANVQEGMQQMGQLETSWNWVFADREGNIGYQMSGLMPRRRKGLTGLVPVPGWLPENDWQGFVPHTELPRCYNPETGYFVTANQDLNAWGQAKPSNMPMGDYRARRIAERLEASNQLTVQDSQRIQLDLSSPQAETFMALLLPLLPESANGRLLAKWDCCYTPDSKGAWLFERVYTELVKLVFGESLGGDVCRALQQETGILADFYANFDRVLLAETSPWFGGRSRESLYRAALAQGLAEAPRAWGAHNRFILRHLLFGGKLPVAAGFDYGPLQVPGGRATPQQGQIYRSGGRETSFVPSYRLVTDFAAAGAHTCLLGGPSDRRFSPWYTSEVACWQTGEYKYLAPIWAQPADTGRA